MIFLTSFGSEQIPVRKLVTSTTEKTDFVEMLLPQQEDTSKNYIINLIGTVE